MFQRAGVEKGYSVLRIIDDGQGLDPRKIRERLANKGIDTDSLTDEEALQFIFKGNLFTRDQATQISGRGIGMEAIMHTDLRFWRKCEN